MTVRECPRWAGVLVAVVGLLALGSASRAAAAEGDQVTRAWPVAAVGGGPRPVVVRGFEPPPQPWAAGHRGVDLAAGRGSPVRAAAAGRVVFAGTVAGRGVLSIELTQPQTPALRITYEPVEAVVTVGDSVTAGQLVGTVGPGPFHCPEGCLHWGLLRGDEYLDPLTLIPPQMRRGGPSRLLPVFGVPPPDPAAGTDSAVGHTATGFVSGVREQAEWLAEGSDQGARLRHDGRPRSARASGEANGYLAVGACLLWARALQRHTDGGLGDVG
ncbi:MAG: M23 family metallopeptidase [Streptomycetaceae bacterium]|nr:M23 family metallopeptidase [Streptomycetaceae bacterium]